MAYIKYRFRAKNASGAYDTYHLESASNMILRFDADGKQQTGNKANVELSLAALESTVSGLVAGGGEPNKIDSITVAGKAVTIDSNKNAAIPVDGSISSTGANPVSGKAVYDYAHTAIAQTTTNKEDIATLNGTGAGSVSKAVSDSAESTKSTLVGSSSDAKTANTIYGAKAYADDAAEAAKTAAGTAAATAISTAIGNLDKADSPVANQVVSAVSQSDGVITVTHRALAAADIPALAQSKITGLSTALAAKVDNSKIGAANGVASLDASGLVPSSQLPSYVDDVLEYDTLTEFPAKGVGGKIYVAIDTNLTYRWSGSGYTEISKSLALGTTKSTAYYGDLGKTAYEHSQSTHARTDATAVAKGATNGYIKINDSETEVYKHPGYTAKSSGLYKITVDATGHVSAATDVTKGDITDLGIPGQDTVYTHPAGSAASKSSGLYKFSTDATSHVSAVTAVTRADIVGLGIIDLRVGGAQPTDQATGGLWLESIT